MLRNLRCAAGRGDYTYGMVGKDAVENRDTLPVGKRTVAEEAASVTMTKRCLSNKTFPRHDAS